MCRLARGQAGRHRRRGQGEIYLEALNTLVGVPPLWRGAFTLRAHLRAGRRRLKRAAAALLQGRLRRAAAEALCVRARRRGPDLKRHRWRLKGAASSASSIAPRHAARDRGGCPEARRRLDGSISKELRDHGHTLRGCRRRRRVARREPPSGARAGSGGSAQGRSTRACLPGGRALARLRAFACNRPRGLCSSRRWEVPSSPTDLQAESKGPAATPSDIERKRNEPREDQVSINDLCSAPPPERGDEPGRRRPSRRRVCGNARLSSSCCSEFVTEVRRMPSTSIAANASVPTQVDAEQTSPAASALHRSRHREPAAVRADRRVTPPPFGSKSHDRK